MLAVSIVIPAYNASAFISRALDSLTCQDLPRQSFEILVINDGSTDTTLEVIGRFQDVRIITQPNGGFVNASNRGFREALGKYVVKLDSDDSFEPALLSRAVGILEADPHTDYVFSDYYEQRGDDRRLVRIQGDVFKAPSIGLTYRKSRLAEEGYWREGILFPEYDLLLRTLGRWHGHYISEPLFTYYRHSESVTASTDSWNEKAASQLLSLHPDHAELIRSIRQY